MEYKVSGITSHRSSQKLSIDSLEMQFNCLRFAIPAEAISGTRRGTLELQDFSKTQTKYNKCSWRRGEAVLTHTRQNGEEIWFAVFV